MSWLLHSLISFFFYFKKGGMRQFRDLTYFFSCGENNDKSFGYLLLVSFRLSPNSLSSQFLSHTHRLPSVSYHKEEGFQYHPAAIHIFVCLFTCSAKFCHLQHIIFVFWDDFKFKITKNIIFSSWYELLQHVKSSFAFPYFFCHCVEGRICRIKQFWR